MESATYINKALREKEIGWKTAESYYPALTGGTIRSIFMDTYGFNPELAVNSVKSLSTDAVKSGNVGVGLGATVGKFSWTEKGECLGMKSGIGSAKIDLGHDAAIYALTVVNALGNVVNPDGSILAGNRHDNSQFRFRIFEGMSQFMTDNLKNTTISIVGTNVKLDFIQQDLKRISEIAAHGQVRAINPVNTSVDGDMVFAFTTSAVDLPLNTFGKEINQGEWWKFGVDIIGQFAAKAVQESIYDACRHAETINFQVAYQGVFPGYKDYK